MEVDVRKVLTHYWLLHPEAKRFHAYTSVLVGADSVCGTGHSIVGLKEMNIPGDGSICCINCFDQLYGVGMSVSPKGVK